MYESESLRIASYNMDVLNKESSSVKISALLV